MATLAELREQRSKARYRRLREKDYESYRRAVEIGSLVTCSPSHLTPLQVGAAVEDAVVAFALALIERMEREEARDGE